MQKPTRLARTTVYESPWVNLYLDKVQFPGGLVIDKFHMLDMPKEAVAVLIENDRNELLFVHAYRYSTNSIEWEIPAGAIDPPEEILDAAQREAHEETGYTTTGHRLLCSFNPMNGNTNKVFHLAQCRAKEKNGAFDPNEIHAIKWMGRDEIKAMIKTGQIRDGFTLTGLLWYLADL
ncbi:MAG: NUDIX hydrolase [Gammaproteobacteria bacterium]|nr:NUDIX hydrolase [Gammaproteobacteria bacterium]